MQLRPNPCNRRDEGVGTAGQIVEPLTVLEPFQPWTPGLFGRPHGCCAGRLGLSDGETGSRIAHSTVCDLGGTRVPR